MLGLGPSFVVFFLTKYTYGALDGHCSRRISGRRSRCVWRFLVLLVPVVFFFSSFFW